MADFDSEFGAFGDPNPPGTTTALGNTAANPNDPLIDWASNLSKDDLAKFLHDPQGSAAEMAARGIPPPPPEAMDQIHNHNEAMGTPSKSDRFSTQPASPLDQPTYRVNPATGRLYNLTSDINQQQDARSAVGAPQQPKALGYIDPQTGFDMPGVPENPPPSQIGQKIKDFFTVPPDAPIRRQFQLPDNAAPPPRPLGGSLDPSSGGFIGPQPPKGEAAPAPAPQQEAGVAEPKSQGDEEEPNAATPEGRKKVADAISTLGKAMQGVKAPEPLRPPSSFAPAPRGPTASGAPNIASLLQAMSRTQTGQVPASALPILRMLGRA